MSRKERYGAGGLAGDVTCLFPVAVLLGPAGAGIAFGLGSTTVALMFFTVFVVALLAAHRVLFGPLDRQEGVLEKRLRERGEAKRRIEIAKGGLTPQQYLDTFTAKDLYGRIRAEIELGL